MKKLVLIFMLGFLAIGAVWGQYVVNFEGAGEIKTSYASGTVNLSGLDWNMTEALIGNLANDFYNGTKSARLRGRTGSSMTMLNAKTNGIGDIIFSYRKYGNDSQVAWKVEYSDDDGATWTQIGSDFTATGTVQQFDENVNATGSILIRIRTEATETSDRRMNVDDITVTDYLGGGTPTPTITVTGDFSAFSTVQGTPSSSQSVAVSGENLTANIDVAALDGYEYSTDDSNWSSSLSLASSYDGSVYARLTGTAAGTYSGDISFSSTGATTIDKAVSGTVYKQEPSNHVSGFDSITGTPSYSSIDIIWDDPSSGVIPDGYLVKGSDIGYASITDPVDGSPEADDALVQNVNPGTKSCTFSDLDENTNYYFKIFPYTNSAAQINYKTDGTVPTTDVLTEYGPPEAPTAIVATAVSHEGFTARWDAVDGATSYQIDVYQQGEGSAATDLFFSEYIEGSSNNKAIEIYNGTGASVDLSDYYIMQFNNGASEDSGTTYTLSLSGTLLHDNVYSIVNSSSTIFSNPSLSTNSSVMNFNGDDALVLRRTSDDSYIDIFGCIGEDPGSAWSSGEYSTSEKTLVRKSTVTSGITTNPTSGFPTLTTEWDVYDQDTADYLGSHTMGAAPTPVASWTDITVNGTLVRVDGLDPSTDYYYVVRAVNANGTSEDSNQIEVSTTVETPGESAGTSIGGASTDVLVPPVGILTDVDVTIDPTGTTDDDFSVTVSISGQNLIYTISCSNNLALNGAYKLNHIGPTNAPTGVNVSTGTIDDQLSDALGTYLKISGIAAKGDLVITAEFDQTLPIELSSFTYTINANNMVSLMWITQSETNVSGFRVYRGETETLAEALMISDLIPASNTSTTQSYVFVDRELCIDGEYYYWLENLDMDGSNGFHGPIMVQYMADQSGNPDIPLVTGLNRIYPNPFNPTTYISYSLAEDSPVMVEIFNQRGQLVRRIADAPAREGNHRIEWNGTDDNGRPVSTGLYLVRLMAGNQSFVRKAILMK